MKAQLRDKLLTLLAHAQHVQSEMILTASEILSELQSDRGNVDEAVYTDCGFLLREISLALDEARKECNAKKELLGRALSFSVITRVTQHPNSELRSVGQLAYGQPDVKQRASLPKPGSEEHKALMGFFGVNHPAVNDFGILAFHWPSVSEWLTALSADGKNPPPGLGTLHPEYTVTYRKRKKG